MLETFKFFNYVPDEYHNRTLYRGTTQAHIKDQIKNEQLYFGSASKFIEDGEGRLSEKEKNEILQFFHIYPGLNQSNLNPEEFFWMGDNIAMGDTYNSCWSLSKSTAQKFAREGENETQKPVVISVQAGSLLKKIESVINCWTKKFRDAKRARGSLPEEADRGWGVVHALAACVSYVTYDSVGKLESYAIPLIRSSRLPNHLCDEEEVRIIISLANSSGSLVRQGEDLEPMITHANDGIYLNGFKIQDVEGYSLVPL